MSFQEHHHALWRELLNCEAHSPEDEVILDNHLRNIQGVLVESLQAQEWLNAATSYLEERAMYLSMLTPQQRQEIDTYRGRRARVRLRDAWQKAAPRTVSKAEHDALLGDERETLTLTQDEYRKMMEEAQR